MKGSENRFRTHHKKDNVRELEKRLSFKERLFSILTLLRGTKWLGRCALLLSIIIVTIVVTSLILKSIFVSSDDLEAGGERLVLKTEHEIITEAWVLQRLGITAETDYASLPIKDLEKKLRNEKCIRYASISRVNADRLHINIREHLPLVYVEMADKATSGIEKRLYMSPERCLFPVFPDLHRKFVNLPVWRLEPSDVKQLTDGEILNKELCLPIINLIRASNHYSLDVLPSILTIERPAKHATRWKIKLQLQTGETVIMSAHHDMAAQMERLVTALQMARENGKRIRQINVVPEVNVPYELYDE